MDDLLGNRCKNIALFPVGIILHNLRDNVTGFVDCCHPACKNINYANNKPQQWIMPQREKPMIVCR